MRYGRATLRQVKSSADDVVDRVIDLEPRAIAALGGAQAQRTSGRVFCRADGSAWHADSRISGAQVNRAFQEVAAKAGLDRQGCSTLDIGKAR